jgi:transposase-like protein
LPCFQARFAKAIEIFEPALTMCCVICSIRCPNACGIDSTNPLERLNFEIRRRTRVIGIFPHGGACGRLMGMLLLEKHEDLAH